MPTKKIPLADIVIDAGTQARSVISTETVADYAERMTEGDQFPPIVLFHDGSAHYLGDGFHRVLASQHNGFVDIDADIRKGTKDDALWFAMGANRTNGHRMTRGDIRHAVELALKTWPDRTLVQIADQIGVGKSTVGRVQTELSQTGKLTPPATRIGADGKSRPTSYTRQTTCADTEADSTPPANREIGPPCAGMMLAEVAVMKLGEIADNDAERDDAFTHVRRWIVKHSSDKSDTIPDLSTMKKSWYRAKKSERETFLQWVDKERSKDLPTPSYKDALRASGRLKRALRNASKGILNHVRIDLADILKEG